MDVFNNLSPSSVRKIILEEHAQLRRKLADVESLYESTKPEALIDSIQELIYFFIKHIEREEQILRPVLKDIDPWGDVRVDRMNAEHKQQRQGVAKLEAAIQARQISEILTLTKKFVSELYVDLDLEEKECLNPDLLKDDFVTSGNYSR